MAQKKERKIEDVSDTRQIDELVNLEDLTVTEVESEIETGKNLEMLEDTCESTQKKNFKKNNEKEKYAYKTPDQNKKEAIYSKEAKIYSRGSGNPRLLETNEKLVFQDNLPESQKNHVPKPRKRINNNKSGITTSLSLK